jgi:hypothetical protein
MNTSNKKIRNLIFEAENVIKRTEKNQESLWAPGRGKHTKRSNQS